MMKQTNSFKFVSLEDVQAKILEIPYKGEELSMMVLLPNEVDGLQEVKPGIHSLHAIAHISSDSVLVWAVHRLVVLAGSIEQIIIIITSATATATAKSLQSCPTLWDPIDGSPPGSPVPGILQAITLEWAAISFSNAWKWKVKVKSLSRVRLLATPWTAAHQAPPSMGFSRQEYWSRCQWLNGKESAYSVRATGDTGSIPGSGSSPRGRNDNPLQYFCLGNPMDRGAWRDADHGVTKRVIHDLHMKYMLFHFCVHVYITHIYTCV